MTVDEALAHLQTDGFCVLDGVIPADEVEGVRISVERTVEADGGASAIQGAKSRKGLMSFD
tara:strand:+ start:534 stop:716 length:183 start_codon:yes stop_codon:yes gene_type:complete